MRNSFCLFLVPNIFFLLIIIRLIIINKYKKYSFLKPTSPNFCSGWRSTSLFYPTGKKMNLSTWTRTIFNGNNYDFQVWTFINTPSSLPSFISLFRISGLFHEFKSLSSKYTLSQHNWQLWEKRKFPTNWPKRNLISHKINEWKTKETNF